MMPAPIVLLDHLWLFRISDNGARLLQGGEFMSFNVMLSCVEIYGS